MVGRAGVHVCGDIRGSAAARWSAGGGGICASAGSEVGAEWRRRAPGVDACGGGLRAAGRSAIRGMDMEELEGVSGLRAPGATVCHRSGGAYAGGMGRLGEVVVCGLCFDVPAVLECSGRQARYLEVA